MRRKSERNKAKSSPESKPEKPKRGRPSRKKKSPSSSPDRDSASEECVPGSVEVEVQDVTQSQVACQSETVTPEKVQSHSDEDNLEVWHVKATETSDSGEIQKLKICLSRPSMTPERPDRSPRGRKKLNRSTSQIDCLTEAAEEKRKVRHRSRRSSAKDSESADVPNSDENVESTISSDTEAKPEKSSVIKVQEPSDNDTVKNEIEQESKQEACETTSQEKPNTDEARSVTAVSTDKICKENVVEVCDKNVLQVSIVTSVNPPEPVPIISESGDIKSETTTKAVEKNSESVETKKETVPPALVEDQVNTSSMDESINNGKSTLKNKPEDVTPVDADKLGTDSKSVEESTEDVVHPVKLDKCKSDDEQQNATDLENAKKSSSSDVNEIKDVQEEKNDEKNDEPSKIITEPSKETPDIVKKVTELDNSESSTTDKNTTVEKPTNVIISDVQVKEPPREMPIADPCTSEDNIKVNIAPDKNVSVQLPAVQDSHTVQSAGNMRKRRWGSRSSKVSKSTIVNISTDSLKNLISNVEPVSAEEVLLEVIVKEPAEIEPPKKVLTECQNKTNGKYSVQDKVVDKEFLGSMSHRKISIVNEEAPKLHRSPSPPKYKSSSILYITNLVRPFTLPQLKNLLQRTGRIVENGFWIDKIKSKCYVEYESEDEAIETRHALHGVTWPVSNPKVLNVDFGSKSAMQEALASGEEDKPVGHIENWIKEQHTRDSKSSLTDMDQKSSDKRTVVREWDLGKGDIKEEKSTDRQANRHRDMTDMERRKRRTKSRSPSPARKFKKKEEEAPSKLLDDLFKKTKTTPCIYWLPLNAETILIKEEQRRKHMAEHERRMEELRRAAEEQKIGRHNVVSHHASTHRHR